MPFPLRFWKHMRNRGKEPHTVIKIVIRMAFMSLYFCVLWLACNAYKSSGLVPVFFLLFAYSFMEVCEICVAPTVIAAASKLSTVAIASTMMGLLSM
jgi:dipeptide/tripeptide permease